MKPCQRECHSGGFPLRGTSNFFMSVSYCTLNILFIGKCPGITVTVASQVLDSAGHVCVIVPFPVTSEIRAQAKPISVAFSRTLQTPQTCHARKLLSDCSALKEIKIKRDSSVFSQSGSPHFNAVVGFTTARVRKIFYSSHGERIACVGY